MTCQHVIFGTVSLDGDLIDLVYSPDRRGWYLERQRDHVKSAGLYPSTHEAKRALFGRVAQWVGARGSKTHRIGCPRSHVLALGRVLMPAAAEGVVGGFPRSVIGIVLTVALSGGFGSHVLVAPRGQIVESNLSAAR